MSKSKLRVEYKTRQPKAPPDSLDIGRSVLVCNVFVFLFSAAKASLFPFLTLYMRYLGFSASQTGLIVGGKTFSALVMAPLWARCAGKRNKRKFMLMFSILMLAAVYLSLTLIPTLQVDGATVDVCSQHKAGNQSQKTSTAPVTSPAVVGATVPASSVEINSGPSSTTTSISTTGIPSISSTVSTISTSTSVQNVTTVPPEHIKIPYEVVDSVQNLLESLNMTITDLSKLTAKKIRHLAGSVPEGQKLSELLKNLNPKETSLLMTLLAEQLEGNTQIRRRDTRDTWSKIKSKVSYYSDKFLENIQVLHKQMFLCVLMILIIGEIFCSPVEKLADDAWYDFLDEVDDLEKYGRQRLLTSFAFILFPILTTLLVDMTPCYLGEHIYHQSIHFYVFGGCLGLTFVVAMFYPVPTPGKRKYVSKVMKGCRVIFCGGRNFIFIVSLLVMGIVYSTSNYLFWVVQDLGGKELPMGVSVAVAAFSEFPMLVFSRKLVQKLGNGGVIALSMLVLSLRQVYYSFLWLDWAVVPIEVLHSISHTAMWWAMLSNPDFSVNSQVDRSIRSILSSLYFGMGYTVGSIISGFVYDEFGHQVLFRAAAVLVASWMLVFVVINRCIPTKTRIRYAKLLSAEDGELSDSSNDFEEDWLEQALRDH